jgi:meso-butanediol dehydrogenase / (S,S)-butanediol dehydrogenase / diacetyl reductase
MGRLKNKVVFLTGTAGSQGRAAALLFAKEGAQIVGCDFIEDAAAETAAMVTAEGGEMTSFCPVDLSDPEAAKRWIDDGVARYGRIDILYNNASAVKFARLPGTQEAWSFTLRHELDLVFNTVTAAWHYFQRAGKGVIINTASVSGHRGNAGQGAVAHCAAKGGVIALTKQLAAEGGPLNIRANSISPGLIRTPSMVHWLSPEQIAARERANLLGRIGNPEDIAYCALYLASDEANWVTGSDFIIDGGLSAVSPS